MPRRRTPRPVPAGFTLLELIIVMFIIGLASTFAVIAVGDGGRGRLFEREQQRFVGVVEIARDDAVLSGKVYGIQLEPTAYDVVRYESDGWQSVESGPRAYRRHTLPDGLTLSVSATTNALDVGYDDETPEILLFPDGLVDAGTVRLTDSVGDWERVLDTSVLSRFAFVEPEGRL